MGEVNPWRRLGLGCFSLRSLPGPEYESPWRDAKIHSHVFLPPIQRYQSCHLRVFLWRNLIFVWNPIWNLWHIYLQEFCWSFLCLCHYGLSYDNSAHFGSSDFWLISHQYCIKFQSGNQFYGYAGNRSGISNVWLDTLRILLSLPRNGFYCWRTGGFS